GSPLAAVASRSSLWVSLENPRKPATIGRYGSPTSPTFTHPPTSTRALRPTAWSASWASRRGLPSPAPPAPHTITGVAPRFPGEQHDSGPAQLYPLKGCN